MTRHGLLFFVGCINLVAQASMSESAASLAKQIVRAKLTHVAVLGFQNRRYSDLFSDWMVSQLNYRLTSEAGKGEGQRPFILVNRTVLERIYKDLQKRGSDRFDPNSFPEIGKFSGADGFVSGDFTVTTNEATVNTLLLNSRGETLGAEQISIPLTTDTRSLLEPSNTEAETDRNAKPSVHQGMSSAEADRVAIPSIADRLVGKWAGKVGGPQGLVGWILEIEKTKTHGLQAKGETYPLPENPTVAPARYLEEVEINPAGLVSIKFKQFITNPGGYSHIIEARGTVSQDGTQFTGRFTEGPSIEFVITKEK